MLPAIRVEKLSKRYRLGATRVDNNLTENIIDGFGRLRRGLSKLAGPRRKKLESSEFWALKDVSFDVEPGEVLGIIGRNGAGKSTLLKVLSRIVEPTFGRAIVRGRIGSLLEVGTGFHPELTGRENIYLNGSILGMAKKEISRKFDEIVAFSEIERFLDTPVKRYSSGMYVRLAFAVAAHLEPEILVVDEVLAVGDVAFQRKCLGKISQVATGGRTVLFVSHNMDAIIQLTKSVVVLDCGRIIFQGTTAEAVQTYLSSALNKNEVYFNVELAPRKHFGTQAARLHSLRFTRPIPLFAPDDDFSFVAKIKVFESIERLRVSMTIFTAEGNPVGSCFGPEKEGFVKDDEREIEVVLPRPRLAPGRYYCAVAIGRGNHKTGPLEYDVVSETLHFEVSSEEGDSGTLATWYRGWGHVYFSDLIQIEPPISNYLSQ